MSLNPVLDAGEPATVAQAAAMENLLRCWCRETGVTRPEGHTLTLELASSGVRLDADIQHWSAAGWHRFSDVRVNGTHRADLATVAALLAREAAGEPLSSEGSADLVALVSRVLDSSRRVAEHVAHRRFEPAALPGSTPFLDAEQALLLGHPLHPTPKSREALTEAEAREYAPELRGSFQPHWFAADRSVVSSDSALADSAERIVAGFAGDELAAPDGTVLVPAHPWQAGELTRRPGVRALLDKGVLHDLGQAGERWFPTSSLRTVCRPGVPVMLKFSLGLRITNSRRENLRKELLRGVEVHRLLEAGLAAHLHKTHPAFDVVRDPAWLAVDLPGERPDSGLDVVLREHPFTVEDRVMCVAGLVAEQPGLGPSRLGALVRSLAGGTPAGETERSVCAEWLRRYVRMVAEPVFWLYAKHGVALEAHQQNTLVWLDDDGWPAGGRYRDNQGYYFAASRIGELQRWLPGLGEASDTTVPDEVADERLGYYLGINNLLGIVGAFGSQRLADERALLGVLRAELRRIHNELGGGPDALTTLLTSSTLRCKANLLTRLRGMDELVGPVSSQSVYVTIPNPLVRG